MTRDCPFVSGAYHNLPARGTYPCQSGAVSSSRRLSVSQRALLGGGPIAVLLGLLVIAAPIATAGSTSTVTVTGSSLVREFEFTQAWQNMSGASLTRSSTGFTFSMTVNATIPTSPALPGQYSQLAWWFCLSTINNASPASFPHGFPHPKNDNHPFDCTYFLPLVWDGHHFAGILTNRTPLLTGGTATTTTIPFTISGATLTLSVSASQVGSPSTFWWSALVDDWSAGFYSIQSSTSVTMTNGNNGYTLIEGMPQVGSGFCSTSFSFTLGALCFADSPP